MDMLTASLIMKHLRRLRSALRLGLRPKARLRDQIEGIAEGIPQPDRQFLIRIDHLLPGENTLEQ